MSSTHRSVAARWARVLLAGVTLAWLATEVLKPATPALDDRAGGQSRMSESNPTRTANRLLREKSPYLLQHAHNPVDWYPWGEEAFEKARREDKPIFLSIGYSTCHWCHVMERESFENDSVAALLNRWFVAIKVDREERPDVDRLYMTSMQAMGMGGGWPLNAFLTPDLAPFYGGTYFPPESRAGRTGMIDLLPRVHEVWMSQRADIESQGARVLEAIAASAADRGRATSAIDPAAGRAQREPLFRRAHDMLAAAYDREHGGFGTAPKFPSVVNLNFLARYWSRDPEHRGPALAMVRHQLDAMQDGGIHDQIGGGFHRYSTDPEWMVSHFEKMLYDQAQLAWAYLDGVQIAREDGPHHDPLRAAEYAATARGIFDYVARDLTSPEGAFYSAEDADSEGEEGKFYVWTPAEIATVLGDDAKLFEYRYGVSARGNFEHATSILHRAHTEDETAKHFGVPVSAVRERGDRARATLLAARSRRVRPHLDDKVLAAWNGIMISAFARGARVLGDPALASCADRAATFVWAQLHDPATGAMRRRWRAGEAAGDGQLDDYMYLALGFLDLYGATFDPQWLERAEQLTHQAIERFWDEKNGGFFESPAGDPHVRIRMKDDFDGAEMAGNSVAACVLHTLAELLDREPWRARADRLFDLYASKLADHPTAMPQMLVAMDLAQSPARHLVIEGDPAAADTRALIEAYDRKFRPRDLLLVAAPGAAHERLAAQVPFVSSLTSRDGRATAFMCVDRTCRLPVTDAAAFAAELDAPTR